MPVTGPSWRRMVWMRVRRLSSPEPAALTGNQVDRAPLLSPTATEISPWTSVSAVIGRLSPVTLTVSIRCGLPASEISQRSRSPCEVPAYR